MNRHFLRLFGIAVLVASVSACGGGANQDAWNDFSHRGSKDALRANCELSLDGKDVTCDVTTCDPDSTIFAGRDGKLVAPLDVCPPADAEPTVTFEKTIPGVIDIVCVAGDSGEPVVIAKNFGEEPTAPAGEETGGGSTGGSATTGSGSGGDVITPSDPGSGSGSTGGGTGGGTGGTTGGTSGGTSGGTTGGGSTGGTTGGNPEKFAIKIIPALLFDSLKAKTRNDVRFGLVDLSWSTSTPADQIEEMYLWSYADFNRKPFVDGTNGTPACGLTDKRYLVVDPATGQNYNPGSPNANAMGGLLEGKVCTGTNDCAGIDTSYSGLFPCRIDLKKDGKFLTAGSVSTLASMVGDRPYFLVVKPKGGSAQIQKAMVNMPEAKISVIPGKLQVALAEDADAYYYDVNFHYENVDPNLKPFVGADNGECSELAGSQPAPNGKGNYQARCKLKPNNFFRLVAPGLNGWEAQVAYHIDLGAPTVTLTNPVASTVAGPDSKGTMSYSVSRPWTFADGAGNPLASGVFTSTKAVGDIRLQVYAVTNGLGIYNTIQEQKGAAKTGSFLEVPLNHQSYKFSLQVSELDGASTVMSNAVEYVFDWAFSIAKVAGSKFQCVYEINAATDWGCGKTDAGCPQYYAGVAGPVTFTMKAAHLKDLKISCTKGVSASVTDGGKPSWIATLTDGNSYTTKFYAVTINVSPYSSSPQGGCTFEATDYSGLNSVSTGYGYECLAQLPEDQNLHP